MKELISIFPAISAILAAFWGIFVFNKQQKFKRLQNLSEIFQRFADAKNSFIDLFTLCDQAYLGDAAYEQSFLDELKNAAAKNKLQYLALLEEVALFARYSEVDKKYAIYLFQWHFYFVYNDKKISEAFWSNLGGLAEKNKPYWQYQQSFANKCNPV